MMKEETALNPVENVIETIRAHIYDIRGKKVMLDRDLAELYHVETKQLKRQVKRNISRFPEDFMFELTYEENDALRCQIGTLKRGEHSKYLPYAFTELGVAMLSTVLTSEIAIQMNINNLCRSELHPPRQSETATLHRVVADDFVVAVRQIQQLGLEP